MQNLTPNSALNSIAPVVIVGAGPTGAAIALLLAQQGIPVKLIEASRNFRRIFRGEALMPSGLDALAQMGLLPILDQIPHRPLDAWEFIIENRSLFRVVEPIPATLPRNVTTPEAKPCTLVSQPALLELLIQKAIAHPHCELIQGTAVQDLIWNKSHGENGLGDDGLEKTSLLDNVDNGRVTGVLLKNGEAIASSLVIGADGRKSAVRQAANLRLEQQSQPFDILWFRLVDRATIGNWMLGEDGASQNENVFSSILRNGQAFGVFRSAEGDLQIGWSVHGSLPEDWQQMNWAETIAAASPPALAEHLRRHAAELERPIRLSVIVGRCPQWCQPGLLLLGDAAHPMSPIRAQGINMALRDVMTAADQLTPVLTAMVQAGANGEDGAAIAKLIAKLDVVLPQIQAAREPEIIRIQALQEQETAQAQRLIQSAPLRWFVSRAAGLLRSPLRQSWLKRQQQLRQGIFGA
jgi:2-polyprenyl-6-methoxyphenol hydroxylase-like FAD-dependent oxidoreductase